MPRIAILIPTYEPNPAHIKQALDSVLAQTVDDWTCLIHDDASTIDVRAMIEPYLRDPRFGFERSERRLGIGGNWNACLQRADGEFIQFLFQDDVWKPTYLEECLTLFEKEPSVGFVAAHHEYRIEGTGPLPATYAEVLDARKNLTPGSHGGKLFLIQWLERGLRPNIVGEPSFVMLRKSLTDAVGRFDGSMHQGLDFEYWIRCLLQTDLGWIADDLGFFRVHGGGASARNRRSLRGAFDRLRCFGLVMQKAKDRDLRAAAKRGRARYLLSLPGRLL